MLYTILKPVPHSVLQPTNPLPNGITTPVNIENFALSQHPDQELCKYLIDGLTNGFDIGYAGPHFTTLPMNLR